MLGPSMDGKRDWMAKEMAREKKFPLWDMLRLGYIQ